MEGTGLTDLIGQGDLTGRDDVHWYALDDGAGSAHNLAILDQIETALKYRLTPALQEWVRTEREALTEDDDDEDEGEGL